MAVSDARTGVTQQGQRALSNDEGRAWEAEAGRACGQFLTVRQAPPLSQQTQIHSLPRNLKPPISTKTSCTTTRIHLYFPPLRADQGDRPRPSPGDAPRARVRGPRPPPGRLAAEEVLGQGGALPDAGKIPESGPERGRKKKSPRLPHSSSESPYSLMPLPSATRRSGHTAEAAWEARPAPCGAARRERASAAPGGAFGVPRAELLRGEGGGGGRRAAARRPAAISPHRHESPLSEFGCPAPFRRASSRALYCHL